MKTKDYYSVPAISNSGMSHINPEQGGSPARYKKFIIDREGEEESTPSLENGKLVHLYVESPEDFIVADVNKPADMLASWAEEVFDSHEWEEYNIGSEFFNSKVLSLRGDRYKNIKDEEKVLAKFNDAVDYFIYLIISNGDKLVLTSSQKEIVENCISSLRSNPVAYKLLFTVGEDFGDLAYNELAITWKNDDLLCKALLDRVRVLPEKKAVEIIDLKTTSKPVSKFPGSFEYWRYYRQMAWYKSAIIEYMNKEQDQSLVGWDINIYMVVVETTGLFETKVFSVSEEWLEKGSLEANDLFNRIKICTRSNDWVTWKEEKNNIIELEYEKD